MGLFSSTTLNSLDERFAVQVQDLSDAEQRLTKAWPRMADTAANAELKSAFQQHRHETEPHIQRLAKVFGVLGVETRAARPARPSRA